MRREDLHREESLLNLPPIRLLEFKFKQLREIVFVPIFPFFVKGHLFCGALLANEN